MSISGLGTTDISKLYPDYTQGANTTAKKEAASGSEKASDAGVIYERSKDAENVKDTKADNSAIIARLKAEQQERMNQLTDLVQRMLTGQGKAYSLATGDDSIWKYLASGEYTVDELARKQAEEDISEDGYWGVKQTSDRILDFAKALSGNDPSKAQELLDAFDKGYKEATGEWGKDLPDISKQTYDAVHKKFEDWMNSTNSVTGTEA